MPEEEKKKAETESKTENESETESNKEPSDDAETEEAPNVEDIAKRVDALDEGDELDRIARAEEEKLAERRQKQRGGKKKGLEASASKRLAKIGEKAKPKRAVPDAVEAADPLIEKTRELREWARKNQKLVQGLIVAAVAAAIGFGAWTYFDHKKANEASVALAQAVADERGQIGDPDKEDDEAIHDKVPVFKTPDERRDAALAKYRDVQAKYKGTGAAYLARLGEGALLLDKRDPDGAIAAFEEVQGSSLAKADAEVRGRATESLGYAYELHAELHPEAKDKDFDKAIEQYKQLEVSDVLGFKQVAQYNEARCYELKGDKAKAIELLKALREDLMKSTDARLFAALRELAEDRLRRLDPDGASAEARAAQRRRRADFARGARKASARAPRARAEEPRRWRRWRRRSGVSASARVALAACVLATSACTTLTTGDRINPETPTWFSRPSGDMNLLFRRSLTIEGRKVGEDYEHGRPEIDVAHNRIFVGSSDHGLYALRAFDGSSYWRFETAGMVQSEPFYDAELDVVYFGSNDGAMYAVRAADGGLVWRFNTGTEISKRAVLYGDLLVFVTSADMVFAVDRNTGKMKWQARRTPALGMEIGGYSGPALDGTRVYVAFSDGHVGAYDVRDGTEKWSRSTCRRKPSRPRRTRRSATSTSTRRRSSSMGRTASSSSWRAMAAASTRSTRAPGRAFGRTPKRAASTRSRTGTNARTRRTQRARTAAARWWRRATWSSRRAPARASGRSSRATAGRSGASRCRRAA